MTRAVYILGILGLFGACGPKVGQPAATWMGKGDTSGQYSSCRVLRGSYPLTYIHPVEGLVQSTPDGDSMKFRPDNPELLRQLGGQLNQAQVAQLRLRSIDALELHYDGGHQHEALAKASRDALLGLAGFSTVSFTEDSPPKVWSSVPQHASGYVLLTGVDPHGRPLVYAFAGLPAEADGAEVPCDPDRIAGSINAGMLRDGMAYPMFYADTPDPVRARLAEIARTARHQNLGLWALDASLPGRRSASTVGLENQVMLPVVYRRLRDYHGSGEDGEMTFIGWLEKRTRTVMVLPAGARTQAEAVTVSFAALVEITPAEGRAPGDALRLRYLPEQILMIPSGAQSGPRPPRSPTVALEPSPLEGKIVITEIMANPRQVDDRMGEYVELFNASPSPVELGGWTLGDDDSDSHTINGPLTIAPGQYLVLAINADRTTNGGLEVGYQYAGFDLGQKGDEIVLLDVEGRLVDRVAYGQGFVANGASHELIDPALDNADPDNWRVASRPWAGSSAGSSDRGSPGQPYVP